MDLVDIFVGVLSLSILEIILGIDNLIFIAILTEKLPLAQRKRARYWGLSFAWVTRLLLLASAVWIVHLTEPLISFRSFTFSVRDLFLMVGGAFLIVKATQEIHYEFVDKEELKAMKEQTLSRSFHKVVIQVGLMDIIFSLDSVLTAIGLTQNFLTMSIAITLAILVMIFASESVSNFITKHPSIKMLALSFLILIGTLLVADGFSFHVPRGYLYFAMAFSLSVESLNFIKRNRNRKKNKK